MADSELDPRLADWAEKMDRIRWSAAILDADLKLVWVSDEWRSFLNGASDEELGVGEPIAEVFMRDSWMSVVDAQSQLGMFEDLAPFLVYDFERQGRDPREILPDQFRPLLDGVEAKPLPTLYVTSFDYTGARQDSDLPMWRVNMSFHQFRDEQGKTIGWLMLANHDVRPMLSALLARGDERMYERMARLVEPGRHQAAVLFCDLHESGRLSRQLSSAAYFQLIRRLWTGIDTAVADHTGIIGKHAGDGASAFFLVDDCGSESAAAAAALRTARDIHKVGEEVFAADLDGNCLMKVGVHWGANLFMGQLVPGGRLDVSALGDEVNETARIQDCAEPGATLVSKQLVEHLTADDASALGIDVEKLSYELVAELPTADEKSTRDAGNISVTTI